MAASANHGKKTAAGRNVKTPTPVATSHVRSGGLSPCWIAHPAAYATLSTGDAARSTAIRESRERSAESWSTTATGSPSARAGTRFAW